MTNKTVSVFSSGFNGINQNVWLEARLYDHLCSKFSPRDRLFLIEGDLLEESGGAVRIFATKSVEVPKQFLEENARSLAIGYAKCLVEVLNVGPQKQLHPFTHILTTKKLEMFGLRSSPFSFMENMAYKALHAAFSVNPLDAWYYAVGEIAHESTLRMAPPHVVEDEGVCAIPAYLIREQLSIDLETALRRDMFCSGLIPTFKTRVQL